MREALIIFVRNPLLGKVKTRIARTMGDEKALEIYHVLLKHTHDITFPLAVDSFVFYADIINLNDQWENDRYQKYLQQGSDLGEKMENAFSTVFNLGYASVCIIGSDCLELSRNELESAFETLETNDIVIGPSTDGGYYLLGMNSMESVLFENKPWSSDEVLDKTIADIKASELRYSLLPTLTDIDNEQDWLNSAI